MSLALQAGQFDPTAADLDEAKPANRRVAPPAVDLSLESYSMATDPVLQPAPPQARKDEAVTPVSNAVIEAGHKIAAEAQKRPPDAGELLAAYRAEFAKYEPRVLVLACALAGVDANEWMAHCLSVRDAEAIARALRSLREQFVPAADAPPLQGRPILVAWFKDDGTRQAAVREVPTLVSLRAPWEAPR